MAWATCIILWIEKIHYNRTGALYYVEMFQLDANKEMLFTSSKPKYRNVHCLKNNVCSMRDTWMIGQLFQSDNNYNLDTWQSRWFKYWTTKYVEEKTKINQKSDLVIFTSKQVSKPTLYCLAWRFSFCEWPSVSFLLFHLPNNRIMTAQYTLYMSLLLRSQTSMIEGDLKFKKKWIE